MAEHEECGHVFVSYVREDASRVNHLQARLESAGIRVWRDVKDLWPGEVWKRRLRNEIAKNSLAFVPCFSRNLSKRTRSTMYEELLWASEEYRKRNPEVPWILPVLFEECSIPTVDLGGGLTLHDLQWVQLAEDREGQLDRLIMALKGLLGQDSRREELREGVRADTDAPAIAKEMRQGTSAKPVLPSPPPWRKMTGRARGFIHQATPVEEQRITAAIHLRRPLLVIGAPGSDKSSLAYDVAEKYELGPVLRWRIRRNSNFQEGLYDYDEVGRSEAARLADPSDLTDNITPGIYDIGSFVRLGPLGTAMLPTDRSRILFVEDLDRGDEDFPNDLIDVLEEGEFEIPELARNPASQIAVRTYDGGDELTIIQNGRIRCKEIPVVVITTSEERELPAAFLRRCVMLFLPPPDAAAIAGIIEAHLGSQALESALPLIDEFMHRREHGSFTIEQLLDAVFLSLSAVEFSGEARDQLADALLPYVEYPPDSA